MRKLTLLLVVTIVITSCSEPEKSERIQWTSSSEVAKNLFEEFLINFRKNTYNSYQAYCFFKYQTNPGSYR